MFVVGLAEITTAACAAAPEAADISNAKCSARCTVRAPRANTIKRMNLPLQKSRQSKRRVHLVQMVRGLPFDELFQIFRIHNSPYPDAPRGDNTTLVASPSSDFFRYFSAPGAAARR
jgi:hypothetical protein